MLKWLIGVLSVGLIAAVIYVAYERQICGDPTKDPENQQSQLAAQKTAGTSVTIGNDHSGDSAHNCKLSMPWWYELFAWPDGFTAWALFLTLCAIMWQSGETARAAEATEKAVETSARSLALQEDTTKRQLRAYIGIKGARLFLHDDGTVEPKVELFNSGQTPAYEIKGAQRPRFSSYPVSPAGRPGDDVRVSVSEIGASLSGYLLGNIMNSGCKSREVLLLELANPKVVFCLNGYYTYRDIFKDTYYIEFQLIVGGPSGVRTDSDSGGIFAVFANDSEGNSSD